MLPNIKIRDLVRVEVVLIKRSTQTATVRLLVQPPISNPDVLIHQGNLYGVNLYDEDRFSIQASIEEINGHIVSLRIRENPMGPGGRVLSEPLHVKATLGDIELVAAALY